MKGATHFIECYYSPVKRKSIQSGIQDISLLNSYLESTAGCYSLKTYCIIFVKMKNDKA